MYEFWYVVGIVFWIAVALYFAVRGIHALRAVYLKTLESVRKEKAKTNQLAHQPENEAIVEKDTPKATTVSFTIPVSVKVPTKARSIWVLKQSSYGGDLLEAVSWDVEKLKARYPGIKWVEDSDGWHEPKARMTDEQWVIEPLDFIQ